MILIMSVNPGFGGQKFIPYSLDKIREARALLDSVGNTEAVVEVDGGVNADTVQAVKEAGATFLVAGSAVFGAADRAAAIGHRRAAVRSLYLYFYPLCAKIIGGYE